MRVERSLLESAPGASKFVSILHGMGMKLPSKFGGLVGVKTKRFKRLQNKGFEGSRYQPPSRSIGRSNSRSSGVAAACVQAGGTSVAGTKPRASPSPRCPGLSQLPIQLSMTRKARQAAWQQCAQSAVSLASVSLPAPDPTSQVTHLVNDLPHMIHHVEALVGQQVERKKEYAVQDWPRALT
eukprot:1155277-Pelagomonas_calceolata.AAC.8